MKRLGLFFGATLLSLSSYCQEDTLTVNVEAVEIEKKMSSLASESFRIVTTLSKQEIAAMPVRTVSDLLDYLPGVDVRSRGTNGVQADMSVRGGTFDQVIVLLNGINITDPQTGHQ
ncbi:MAG: Plug domain-containing protein, partial [Bacteroidales bacterium]|nr:Plug domain-containing protein [Bacteroidales bacterium]